MLRTSAMEWGKIKKFRRNLENKKFSKKLKDEKVVAEIYEAKKYINAGKKIQDISCRA